jgi:molybdate transport system substrate-binding protein
VTPAPGGPAELQIYAAASLKSVLTKVKAVYESGNPGITLNLSTDSSAALETKIEQGAPADVFLSADTANPQKLVDAGLAEGGVVKIAGNLLTIIVPAGNPGHVANAWSLANPGVKVIAAADGVPITKYAAQLVANLAKLMRGGSAGFAPAYAANVVSREDNVGAVVAKIALGEGDAAIVYLTDAKAADKVETVPVPDAANVPATYGAVALARSKFAQATASFLAWLTGPEGRAVFAEFGFLPAP